jgi:hypothetical protein
MKKSTILIGSALVFFLGTLTAFNFVMKAEYETGHYKDPYHEFVSRDFTGFDAVEVNGTTSLAASKIAVKIVQGPYQVRLHNRVQDFVQIRQEGKKLVIEVNKKEKDTWTNYRHVVYISCPKLNALTTTTDYTVAGKPHLDLYFDDSYIYRTVQVVGFEQDSLKLTQDHATTVELIKTKLGYLHGVLGVTPGSGSKLVIGKGNQINSAALDIKNKSTLFMHDVKIPSLAYQFSDSAKAEFSGRALGLLSHK